MGLFTEFPEVPLGFGIALCKNPDAMHKYNSMTEAQKRAVISRTHAVDSKEAMGAFVDSLADEQIIQ